MPDFLFFLFPLAVAALVTGIYALIRTRLTRKKQGKVPVAGTASAPRDDRATDDMSRPQDDMIPEDDGDGD